MPAKLSLNVRLSTAPVDQAGSNAHMQWIPEIDIRGSYPKLASREIERRSGALIAGGAEPSRGSEYKMTVPMLFLLCAALLLVGTVLITAVLIRRGERPRRERPLATPVASEANAHD